MKTLANCKPTEFLAQTNKIRKYAEKWLKTTGIMEIRKSLPEIKTTPEGATLEEKEAIAKENRALLEAQSSKNLSRMLDAALDEHPTETLELLALCCFIDPEEVDNHEITEYLNAVAELIGNQAVLNFFTSLVLLGQTVTSEGQKM